MTELFVASHRPGVPAPFTYPGARLPSSVIKMLALSPVDRVFGCAPGWPGWPGWGYPSMITGLVITGRADVGEIVSIPEPWMLKLIVSGFVTLSLVSALTAKMQAR